MNDRIPTQPSDLVKPDDQGVSFWRRQLVSLSVVRIHADAGARHLVVIDNNEERYRFRLSGDDAQHLARLLAEPAPVTTEASP